MLEPAEPGRGWTVLFVGILAVAAMLGAGRLEGRRRTIAAVVAIVPLAALMLMAGRVADELVLPGGWSELAGGISRGISDLPGVRVPVPRPRRLGAHRDPARRLRARRCSPRCWRSGRAAPSSGSRRSRCWR